MIQVKIQYSESEPTETLSHGRNQDAAHLQLATTVVRLASNGLRSTGQMTKEPGQWYLGHA